ncbi:outer membrane beta-barrel protein [Mucilaginibacter sp. CSA2-8R]|uniref:type IX secretion/gliding motility protein PorT/SprT n=1 Tax=Mucilaginibacter sp. CSA2-8R TaxID=3141542 RepID=UPI00315D2208
MQFKKVILWVLVLASFTQARAQGWGGGADQNKISFGFSFQAIQQYYKVIRQPYWQQPLQNPDDPYGPPLTSGIAAISSRRTPGFAVGFISRYSLTEHLEARLTPALVFADRELNYTFYNPSDNTVRQVQATTVDVPLLLKIKSDKVGNVRAYLVGGVKYSMAISKQKEDLNQDFLQRKILNTRNFASYEAGIGCDIYFQYFKMSPELKIANSMGNLLIQGTNPLSSPIDKLFLHQIMFSLHFE